MLREIAKAIYDPGHITIDASCEGYTICILPEESKVWDCNTHSGQKYEADAVGWYNADGTIVDGFKVPNNCVATVFCEVDPKDPNWVKVTIKAICAGWIMPTPTPIIPGEGYWPTLPPYDEFTGPPSHERRRRWNTTADQSVIQM